MCARRILRYSARSSATIKEPRIVIQFYTLPAAAEMQVYNGETGGRAWDDATYALGAPSDWSANNTEAHIKRILQARSSGFAFADTDARASYTLAVKDDSTDVMVVLKGVHQYKAGEKGALASAHITVAWFANLFHLNVGVTGVGSGVIGVASLGVRSATEGKLAKSSKATGWTTA
jgi:hypothetical protein